MEKQLPPVDNWANAMWAGATQKRLVIIQLAEVSLSNTVSVVHVLPLEDSKEKKKKNPTREVVK